MDFPSKYAALKNQHYSNASISIVPIRYQDRHSIMKWRTAQMFNLRQSKKLTKEDQDDYFNTVVFNLFDLTHPTQLLFSYLEDGRCVGYGGLVHINWIDNNAELSFIMNTELEKEHFTFHWENFLSLIERVAFDSLGLHKISTYAFDLRPHLYTIFESNSFVKEARLKEHCYFNGKYIDVIIHSKYGH